MSDIFRAPPSGVDRGRRHPVIVILAGLLFLEAAALALAAGFVLVELFIEEPLSYATAIAMFVLTAGAAVWMFFVALGTLQLKSWVRGAALFWQLVQLALALGSFQGLFARPDIGFALLVPAVLVIVLLFSKPVMEGTARRRRDADAAEVDSAE